VGVGGGQLSVHWKCPVLSQLHDIVQLLPPLLAVPQPSPCWQIDPCAHVLAGIGTGTGGGTVDGGQISTMHTPFWIA
jgi:hypothetical protein